MLGKRAGTRFQPPAMDAPPVQDLAQSHALHGRGKPSAQHLTASQHNRCAKLVNFTMSVPLLGPSPAFDGAVIGVFGRGRAIRREDNRMAR